MIEVPRRSDYRSDWVAPWQTVQPRGAHKHLTNKAFQSLSFKGLRGYSAAFTHRPLTAPKPTTPSRHDTFGALLVTGRATEEQYALVQGRYTGKWSFPKGHANDCEEPLECTLREVAEETGIDSLPPPSEYKQIGYGKYYVFQLPNPIPLIPRDTAEIADTKWATIEEMKSLTLNADASMFLKGL